MKDTQKLTTMAGISNLQRIVSTLHHLTANPNIIIVCNISVLRLVNY